ncbi:zinc finger matrin-type protein 5 [Coccinella septempunctata]|uniref:zinc finger matrin-type protein 5 n=1 Tax=Coccinella septempunctata TaxID=41139 RepID=UPI001D06CD0F|nr:zinc finger matrin-type protein 5 [Coccinella septempunctata]XP_044763579.1 zinc finger matrin-type protein 5 [Coccinella septempunctata]
MGRRYYCDYCDKTFIDDVGARKKHLQSSHHIKLRNWYYDDCRDPSVKLKEEITKAPCRRYEQNGTCQFAGNCKYRHYTQEELAELAQQVEMEKALKQKEREEALNIPTLDSWMERYSEKHMNKTDSNIVRPFWTFPTTLERRADLPPSLKKYQENDFLTSEIQEWG